MPTSNEHVEAKTLYEKALDAKINPPQPKPEPEEEVSQPEVKEESKPETVTEPVAEATTDKAETVKTETADDIKDEPVKDEKPEAKEDVADQGKLSKGYCRLVSCGLIGREKKLEIFRASYGTTIERAIRYKSDKILASWWRLCFKSCPNIHYT